LEIFPAIIILIAVILVGILFDIIGVAITVANEHEFHAKATKKAEGSKASIFLIRNSAKVANICADVIGDICGIISGGAGVTISSILATKLNCNILIVTLITTAIIASLTIGGKALGKSVAINKSTFILYRFSKMLSYIYK